MELNGSGIFYRQLVCSVFMNGDDSILVLIKLFEYNQLNLVFLWLIVFSLNQSGKSKCSHVFDWR